MKYVLISGVSGGMGFATAKKFIENGYFVFGLDIRDLPETTDNLMFIKTDLREQEQIKKAYELISKETQEIDLIINMAGTYDINSLIEMSEEDFINIFNVNVFAVYRLNRTFEPLLKQKGKIIITSSELAPLDPLPFTGLYGITKETIEKYAFSLRMELQLLNKQVVVIRPGAVKTSFLDLSNERIEKFTDGTKLYKYNAERFYKIIHSVESRNIPPEKIANLAFKISKKKKPKYVYKINRNPLLLIMHILPKKLQNYIIKKILANK